MKYRKTIIVRQLHVNFNVFTVIIGTFFRLLDSVSLARSRIHFQMNSQSRKKSVHGKFNAYF